MLIVTPSFDRDGGVAAHVLASASALAAENVSVSVLAGRVDDAVRFPGVEVRAQAALLDRGSPIEHRLRTALDGDWDVAHLHQLDEPGIVAALRRRGPVVVSAHAYTACTSGHHHFRPGQECMRAHGPGCIANLARCGHTSHPQTLPRRYLAAGRGLAALRGSDLAVSYSTAIDRHLEINGVSPRAIVPLFPTIGAAERPGAEQQPDARRVLFAGRLVAAKGAAVLIRAARDVDATFVIAGEGRDRARLERLAAQLGIADRVRFAGWLDASAMADELAAASIVAVPSVWPEPFGLVGIEALAAGRPVVASATGGTPDWLRDGVTGRSVPPGDAIALARSLNELLADPDRARELAERGRVLVSERFTPERHVIALRTAYAEAAAAWRGARPVRA